MTTDEGSEAASVAWFPSSWDGARPPPAGPSVVELARRLLEQLEVDGVGHHLVAEVVRVQVVAAVVPRQEERRVAWIPRDRVEVDHGVVRPTRADPSVDRLAVGLPRAGRPRRGQRGAVDLDPEDVRSLGELLVAGDDLVGLEHRG